MPTLAALFGFVAIALAGYAAATWLAARRAARRALAGRLADMTGVSVGFAPPTLLKDQRLSSIPTLDAALRRTPLVLPFVRLLRQAGLRRRVGEVVLYIALLAVTGMLVTKLAGGATAPALVVGGALALVPIVVLRRMRRLRTMRFAEQLPDALDLVRSALQAGHGLQSALGVVAETFPEPIAQEFRWVVEELRLGLTLREALYNLTARVDDPNLPVLVVGILVSQDVGGNLAEVAENIAHTIRERAKLARQTQVMTAQGRLSGALLTSLPFIVAVAMYAMNPAYYAPMLTTGTGHAMLAYAVLSLVAGNFVIRRLVDIRV